MKNIFVCFILFTNLSVSLYSQNISNLSFQEYSNHIMHYFEAKNDNIIYETIEIYKNMTQNTEFDKFDTNVMFFFYGIKKDNIDRYNNFHKIVLNSGINKLNIIFENIEGFVVDSFLLDPPITASLNDFYWSLYFSSGNISYLDKIIEIINGHKTSNDIMLYLVANSGIWSFMANTKAFPSVFNYIVNNQNINAELKNIILKKDINEFYNETVEYIKLQTEKGIW